MQKIHKERLLKLADFLENKVPNKHFNLSKIAVSGSVEFDQDLLTKAINGEKIKCRAAACAVGWLPAVFPRSFEWQKTFSLLSLRAEASIIHKKTKDSDAVAASNFFGLTPHQCGYLFLPDNYRTMNPKKSTVVRRIRNFVESDGGIPKKVDPWY